MSKIIICRRIELDYGHTLPNHYSFCNQIHGHRAVIEAYVSGEVNTTPGDSSEGMVLDFSILKKLMMEHIHGVLDHGFAVWDQDAEDRAFIEQRNSKVLVTPQPPTAEYLAEWAFHQVGPHLPQDIALERIVWWETPNSRAVYGGNVDVYV